MVLSIKDAVAGTVCPKCEQSKPAGHRLHLACGWVGLTEAVDHPSHYGGSEDPFEHIKVAEAKGWGYHIGNATKYLWRAGIKTPDLLQDLKKAKWYLDRYIELLEKQPIPLQGIDTGPDTKIIMMQEKK